MILTSQKGHMTITGTIIAGVLSGISLMAVYAFYSASTAQLQGMENRQAAESEMRLIRDLIEKDFTTRYLPGVDEDPASTIVSGAGIPTGCDGVVIIRRHIDTNTLERVRYETLCPQAGCTLGAADTTVRVTRWPDLSRPEFTQLDFPLSKAVVASQLCIREVVVDGTVQEILAEQRFFYPANNKLVVSSEHRTRVSLADRYEGVELAP